MKYRALKKYVMAVLCCLVCYMPLQAHPLQEGDGETEDMSSYLMRTVPDSLVQQLKQDKRFQYHDIVEKPKNPGQGYNWFEQLMMALFRYGSLLRGIVIALLIAGLGWLLYTFMKNNGLSIFRSPKQIEGLEEVQDKTLQTAAGYESKIRAATAAGDIRQAIRWWYLYTLFQLASRQLITPGREKTNNDHLRSMRTTPYYKVFATLTLDYEYIWYGGFEISADNFREINQQFQDFNNLLGKAS